MRINDKNIGDGLNEGFTVWLTEKIIGTSMSKEAYTLEKIYIETIAELKGEKETIKIAGGNYNEIAELLNMSMGDFIIFVKSLDIASAEFSRIDTASDYENPSERTKIDMETFNLFHGSAQCIFIKEFIIPEFEERIEKEGLTFKNIESLCYIVSNFKGINETSKFGKDNYEPQGQQMYLDLENYLRAQCIDYSNEVNLDELSDIEIMDTHSIYDFVFDRLRK